jgi:enoyl-CoA hydratase
MIYTTILTNFTDGIFTIAINRPDKLNALNAAVFNDLDSVLNEVYTNMEIKAVVITGSGAKAFVAGADITEFQGLNKEQALALAKRGQDVFFKIENCPKPIVAAVNGFALGGGCELAMACHFRYCSDNAKFGQPEVNLGLIAGYGGTQRLTQLIGKGRSMELHLSGAMMDAQQAAFSGLVNKVCTQETLLEETTKALLNIIAKAPVAIAKAIECINVAVVSDSAYTNGKTGYDKEVEAFGDCFDTIDMKEGVTAFLEKRKPNFVGK